MVFFVACKNLPDVYVVVLVSVSVSFSIDDGIVFVARGFLPVVRVRLLVLPFPR